MVDAERSEAGDHPGPEWDGALGGDVEEGVLMPGSVMSANTVDDAKIVLSEAFLRAKAKEILAFLGDKLPVEVGIRKIDFGTENDLSIDLYVKKIIKIDGHLKLRVRLNGPRTIRIKVEELEASGVSVRGLLDPVVEAFPGIVTTVGEQEYDYEIQQQFVKLTSLRTDGDNLVLFGDMVFGELMAFLAKPKVAG
jgi:hypothetical protein